MLGSLGSLGSLGFIGPLFTAHRNCPPHVGSRGPVVTHPPSTGSFRVFQSADTRAHRATQGVPKKCGNLKTSWKITAEKCPFWLVAHAPTCAYPTEHLKAPPPCSNPTLRKKPTKKPTLKNLQKQTALNGAKTYTPENPREPVPMQPKWALFGRDFADRWFVYSLIILVALMCRWEAL